MVLKLKKNKENTSGKNIVLIGMRGAGKSMIAEYLAEKLAYQKISLDKMISQEIGISIDEFVAKYHWEKFREVENACIKKIVNCHYSIIDCGGGVVEKSQNISLLKSLGFIVYLFVSVNTAWQRIKDDHNRPRLTEKENLKEEIQAIFDSRHDKYLKLSQLVVENNLTTKKEQLGKEIIRHFLD